MKIVYLNPVGVLGGAERVLLAVLRAVRRQAPAAKLVLVTGGEGTLLERTAALGVETICLPMEARIAGLGDSERKSGTSKRLDWVRRAVRAVPAALEYTGRLRRLLERLKPDLIHSNGLKMHLLGGLARPASVPVVWHLHDFYGLRPVVPYLLRPARQGVRGAIAISAAVARDARRLLPGVPIKVIFNTVDTESFRPGPGDGAALDRLACLRPAARGAVRIGLVATYARWKGHEVFLEAAARLAGEPEAAAIRFYVVGGPIYATRAQHDEVALRQRAEALRLGDRIAFVPFQHDTAAVYRGLDVVVHASTQPEPFGLTVAEAMSCGRAVIVSRAGGAAELFTPDVDGVGVRPGDVEELANAMRRLANDGDLRERLGRGARETALLRFAPGRLGGQVMEAYERVLGRRGRVPGE